MMTRRSKDIKQKSRSSAPEKKTESSKAPAQKAEGAKASAQKTDTAKAASQKQAKANNSVNLIKKAIGDTRKEAKKASNKAASKETNPYIKNEDGRRIITLKKLDRPAEDKEEPEAVKDKHESEPQSKDGQSSNILDRLKPKGKATEKPTGLIVI